MAVLSARRPLQLCKHAGSGRDLNLSVASSTVSNVWTDKLVCNKRKSVLSESILTVLSFIEINRNSSGTKKNLYQASVCCNRVHSNEVLL